MSKEIALGIIERAKKILDVDDNSPLELLQLLRRHRKNFHPDCFTDELAKKDAQLKFVEISNLIQELDSYIQRDRINKSPMELALYQPLYDNTTLQTKLDNALEENESLKNQIENLENKIRLMQNDLGKKEAEAIDEKQAVLIKFYKPSNNRIFSISLLLIITGIIPILTKIESLSTIIIKYAPFTTKQINTTMFYVFFIIIVASLINWIQYGIIREKLYEIKSPDFQSRFFETLHDKSYFTEHDVYSYISGQRNIFKKIMSVLGIKIFRAETMCQLKDVFIYNVISMQLADISYAEELDRKFRIKSKPKYYSEF